MGGTLPPRPWETMGSEDIFGDFICSGNLRWGSVVDWGDEK